ncbi:hypothetical protein HY620_00865 [Candidatus Uhrbacteria bacterium]|nr:hypothetical protein [Candidatus Uhrbacteria bacterium]
MTTQQLLQVNIIDELGLSALPDDQKTQLVAQITTIVQKSVMIRIYDALRKQDKNALNALVEEKGVEDSSVIAFIQEKVPDLGKIFEEEIANVKRELIEQVKGKKKTSTKKK